MNYPRNSYFRHLSPGKMKLNEVISNIVASGNTDLYLFNADIDFLTANRLIDLIRKRESKKPNCTLILVTNGGDPDAAYRMVKAIRRHYVDGKFTLYVFGACKSAGTLVAVGADEIVMCDYGELGPLDIQLTKEDEMMSTSGLSYGQSLASLTSQIFKSFEHCFLDIKHKSTITTKTAAEISCKLAVGLISPISAQVDPIRLGEVQRAVRIADAYGLRLTGNTDLLEALTTKYPSHSFVIDFEEARDLFPSVRWADANEATLEIIFDHSRLLVPRATRKTFVIEDMSAILDMEAETKREEDGEKPETDLAPELQTTQPDGENGSR